MSDILKDYHNFMETARWLKTVGGNGWNEWDNIKCPECGAYFEHVSHPTQYKYCPTCGTKLWEGTKDE